MLYYIQFNIEYSNLKMGNKQTRGNEPRSFVSNDIALIDKNFTIISKIGSGGFGEVYKVSDSTGKFFAIKKIYKESKFRYV